MFHFLIKMYTLCIPCVCKLATDVQQQEIAHFPHYTIMSQDVQHIPDILLVRREMLKLRYHPMRRKGMISLPGNLIMEQETWEHFRPHDQETGDDKYFGPLDPETGYVKASKPPDHQT